MLSRTLREMELTMLLPWTHLRPASTIGNLEESIMNGTLIRIEKTRHTAHGTRHTPHVIWRDGGAQERDDVGKRTPGTLTSYTARCATKHITAHYTRTLKAANRDSTQNTATKTPVTSPQNHMHTILRALAREGGRARPRGHEA